MRRVLPVAGVLGLLLVTPALADVPSFAISLKNNQFVPAEVQIPAGVKVKLLVRNENQTPSEFESSQFHREKIVARARRFRSLSGRSTPAAMNSLTIFIRKPAAIWLSNSE